MEKGREGNNMKDWERDREVGRGRIVIGWDAKKIYGEWRTYDGPLWPDGPWVAYNEIKARWEWMLFLADCNSQRFPGFLSLSISFLSFLFSFIQFPQWSWLLNKAPPHEWYPLLTVANCSRQGPLSALRALRFYRKRKRLAGEANDGIERAHLRWIQVTLWQIYTLSLLLITPIRHCFSL